MSGSVSYHLFSQTDVRFCIVGWNTEENDLHAAKIEELRQYAGRAVSAGLTVDEIKDDILNASGSLFEGVDLAVVPREGRRDMVTIVAIAAGRTESAEALVPRRVANGTL